MPKTTSYSISGINPTTSLKEVLASFGYDENNMPAMWGDAVSGISSSNIIYGTTDPTRTVIANKNDFYYNTVSNKLFICSSYEDVDSINNIVDRTIVMNPTITLPVPNATFDGLEYKVANGDGYIREYYSMYTGLQIGTRTDDNWGTPVTMNGFFWGTEDENPIDYKSYKTVGDIYSYTKTGNEMELDGYGPDNPIGIHIYGGIDTTNEDLIQYMKENGTILGSGSTWVEVRASRCTNNNFVVSGSSDDSYTVTGGTANLFVNLRGTHTTDDEELTDVGSQLAKFSYENVVVGGNNELGDLTNSSSGSMSENIVVGRGNKLGPNGSSRYCNLVLGRGNTVMGTDGYCGIVSGSMNNFNATGGICLGDNNNVCASQSSDVGSNYGGYGINVIGRNNTLSSATYDYTVIGHNNTTAKSSYIFGYGNINNSSGPEIIVGYGNSGGIGGDIIIGKNSSTLYGGFAIGSTVKVSNGSLGVGTYINKNAESLASLPGGSHVLIGNEIALYEGASSCTAFGKNIDAGCTGAFFGESIVTRRQSGADNMNATFIGRYNEVVSVQEAGETVKYFPSNIPSGITMLIADGTSENARHNLMYVDSTHNAHFSDCVFATNIPDAPSVAGTYKLQVVVDGSGNKTYSWV